MFPIVSLLSQQDDSGDVLAPAHCQIKGYNPFIWDDDHDVRDYDKCAIGDNEFMLFFYRMKHETGQMRILFSFQDVGFMDFEKCSKKVMR